MVEYTAGVLVTLYGPYSGPGRLIGSVSALPQSQTIALTIRLHPLANQSSDNALRHLCDQLNETETLFPGTELRLIYELISSQTH